MYLLDTHILLWAAFEPHKLSSIVQSILKNDNLVVNISVASLWEIQIKKSIGKLPLPAKFEEGIRRNYYVVC